MVIKAILSKLRRIINFSKIRNFDYRIERLLLLAFFKVKQKKKLKQLKKKDTINVVFFVINDSSWKYAEVYKRLKESGRFNVNILVCPMVNRGEIEMIRTLESSYKWYERNNYNVTMAYDPQTGNYIDARYTFHPDIIFYSNPYKGLIEDRYFITKYPDVLTVYCPYAFNNNSDFDFCFNGLLHNLVWRFYFETNDHMGYAVQASLSKGRNAVVTGYPGIEQLINGYVPKENPWKVHDNKLKRIIWAPHWTIQKEGGSVNYSCFLQYYEGMVDLARKYSDKVQFVFKPHPLLRVQLEQLWGIEQTDKYYSLWSSMSNTGICESAYQDLFLTSDAMIHDSGSFINEYLYMNKPVLRTMKHGDSVSMYDPFTQKALDYYYKAYGTDDVEQFIINVINGIDPLKDSRTTFVNDYMMPPGGRLPSENILHDIIDSIDNQILFRN